MRRLAVLRHLPRLCPRGLPLAAPADGGHGGRDALRHRRGPRGQLAAVLPAPPDATSSNCSSPPRKPRCSDGHPRCRIRRAAPPGSNRRRGRSAAGQSHPHRPADHRREPVRRPARRVPAGARLRRAHHPARRRGPPPLPAPRPVQGVPAGHGGERIPDLPLQRVLGRAQRGPGQGRIHRQDRQGSRRLRRRALLLRQAVPLQTARPHRGRPRPQAGDRGRGPRRRAVPAQRRRRPGAQGPGGGRAGRRGDRRRLHRPRSRVQPAEDGQERHRAGIRAAPGGPRRRRGNRRVLPAGAPRPRPGHPAQHKRRALHRGERRRRHARGRRRRAPGRHRAARADRADRHRRHPQHPAGRTARAWRWTTGSSWTASRWPRTAPRWRSGDCANMPNPVPGSAPGERIRLESVNNAIEHAKVAAYSLDRTARGIRRHPVVLVQPGRPQTADRRPLQRLRPDRAAAGSRNAGSSASSTTARARSSPRTASTPRWTSWPSRTPSPRARTSPPTRPRTRPHPSRRSPRTASALRPAAREGAL